MVQNIQLFKWREISYSRCTIKNTIAYRIYIEYTVQCPSKFGNIHIYIYIYILAVVFFSVLFKCFILFFHLLMQSYHKNDKALLLVLCKTLIYWLHLPFTRIIIYFFFIWKEVSYWASLYLYNQNKIKYIHNTIKILFIPVMPSWIFSSHYFSFVVSHDP